jgi:hypothetical protein
MSALRRPTQDYVCVPLPNFRTRRFVVLPRSVFVVYLLAVAACACPPAIAQQSKVDATSVRNQLLGAWRLISIETIRSNGEVIYPFYGKHPQGLIVYDASGWVSVQITSDPKPTVPQASSREAFRAASAPEKLAAVEGYYAYWGTWTLDAVNSTVTHHIKESLYPGERGEDGVRHYSFNGDRLTLVASTREMGEEHQRKLVWQRLHD